MNKLLLCLPFLVPILVQGQDIYGTGNKLIANCELIEQQNSYTFSEGLDIGYCMGLARGVATTVNGLGVASVPKEVTTGQLARVVLLYLRNHPDELTESDAFLAFKAIVAAFPKKKLPAPKGTQGS